MKKILVKKYIVPLFLLVFTAAAWLGVKQVAGAVQQLKKIEAEYIGSPVAVGGTINPKDFYVTATYQINDGGISYEDEEEVSKGYTISPTVIKKKGNNPITVTYQNKRYVVMVEGKAVDSISASYTGEELYVGSTIPLGKIEVYAMYDDYSEELVKDFTLSTTKVLKEGDNIITVTYQGKKDSIHIYGKAPLAVEEIYGTYDDGGKPVIEGNPINKSNFEVYAVYNDGSEPKKVTNFTISPAIAEREGENKITISYGGCSCVEYVYAEERYITEMRATYKGPGCIVGKKVNRDDIEVIVTYNDGSEEATDEFETYGEKILFEGENYVLVYCEAFDAEIIVYGVRGFAANYDNAVSKQFTGGADNSCQTEVTLGMNIGLERNKFTLQEADSEMVEYMVHRVMKTDEYVGFEVVYDDDEMVTQFPMAMKVTLPEGFEQEKFGVYYTPNKSTIMAKVDGSFLENSENEYEFVVYEPGAYILVHEVSSRLVTEIIVDTELSLRENRSYSLNPVVFPIDAENKKVTYYSTDEDVATVSENGKIRTHSVGTCEIWIEAEDDSGVYVVVEVEVKK